MDKKIENIVPEEIVTLLSERIANRPLGGAGKRLARGEQTKRRIIDAAFELFVSRSAEDFTMRNLAAELDMRVGNLTYHYNTKSELLESLVRDRLAAYAQDILNLLQVTVTSPLDALEKTVTYLVQDLRQPEIGFFPQLWARALHDPQAAELMEEIHEVERQLIAGLISATRPDWEKSACDGLSLHITASIEGLTIFIGQNRKSQGIYKAPEEEIIRVLRKVL